MNNIDPSSDKLYYRLKQIDFDGNSQYSKTITVDAQIIFGVNIYPNPFSTNLTLTINSNNSNHSCNFQLLEITGRLLFEKNYTLVSNQSTIDISEHKMLNPGIYFIKITIGKKSIFSKIIKSN